MDWIYLSPHLDDAVLSCGGLIARQVEAGERVAIWTICAGDPPNGLFSPFATGQHRKWGLGTDAMAIRREEDRLACTRLGASWTHLPTPDCIYRRSAIDGSALYATEEAIFGPLDQEERALVDLLANQLAGRMPGETQVVCPLAIGGHVDHRLTRAAAQSLDHLLWYYADYPYIAADFDKLSCMLLAAGIEAGETHLHEISADNLAVWQAAVAAYSSQLPVFWSDDRAMHRALADFQRRVGGIQLFRVRD